jgi:RNA polymerase sigma-70 factor (ECF subfamily)
MIDAMTMPAALLNDRTASGKRAPQMPMSEARFEAFYRATAGNLWAYIYRLTGNADTSDDLLQKAFFRMLRATPAVESEEHLRRYLFRTATNLVFDHFRESRRFEPEEALPPTAADTTSRDLRHDMQKMFGELKPQERALLWLAHVEEASHDEIGEALGVKSKSVRVLLFRARKRLAAVLKQYGIGPEVAR